MKKAKKFDCVREKDRVQARLAREWRGLTDEQIRQRVRDELAKADDAIGRLWRAASGRAPVSKGAAPRPRHRKPA